MSDALKDFVNFHATLKGDEKSESQIFLDRFFQKFHYTEKQDSNFYQTKQP